MMTKQKTTTGLIGVILCTGVLVVIAEELNSWWWSIGPTYRGAMEARVSGPSYVQQLGLRAARPGGGGVGSTGSALDFANRTYDDGFVAIDPGTIASGDGLTWYWGYANAGQYNAAADSLTFTRSGLRVISAQTLRNQAVSQDDEPEAWGFEFTVGRQWASFQKANLEIQAGIAWLGNLDSRFTATPYVEQITDRSYSIVDTYQLDGVVPPDPPYVGTYDGPGPLIPNRPTSRSEVVTASSAWNAENLVRLDLNATFQQVWIGPRIVGLAGDQIRVFCVPFVSLTRLDARWTRDESFETVAANGRRTTLARWHDRKTDEELLLGIGIRVGAQMPIGRKWFCELVANAETVETAETQVGPQTVSLDLSGYGAALQIGRFF